ncbi:hypothetical protein CFC21_057620, partial [Triticum aestivum]
MSELASTPCSSKSTRRTTNGVDRVSSLPDELLHHMMSFLPMPEVVRTSLLSTRWRNLWASTPYIRINHHDFKDYGKLKKFGDHLLLLRDGATSLDEARILANNVDTFTCCEWVRHAIMQKLTFERDLLTCLVFSNLTSLVLGDWCMAADLYPLRRILHRSPKLKEL